MSDAPRTLHRRTSPSPSAPAGVRPGRWPGSTGRCGPGETLALVGESGSGKSMTVLAATGLAPAAARVTGRVELLGEELTTLPERSAAAGCADGMSASSSRTR